MKLDLNCDLGEGEPLSRTRALMRWITSANVACGGHAGDLGTMRACVRLAKRYGVKLGAHPGPWSRTDFGRGSVQLTPDQFELLLLQQVSALERIARQAGIRLHHIKLHGGLYHASEADAALGRRYIEAAKRWWPQVILYVRSGGRIAGLAKRTGVRVWEETFADRAYHDDGSLVSRGEQGALLIGAGAVRKRTLMIQQGGQVETITGQRLALRCQTLCLHSDTPRAVALAKELACLLD